MKYKLVKQYKNGRVDIWNFSKEFISDESAVAYVQKRFSSRFLKDCILMTNDYYQNVIKYF